MPVLPALLFIKLSISLSGNKLTGFDNVVYKYVSAFISDGMTVFMRSITFLGAEFALACIALAFIVIFWNNKVLSYFSKIAAVNLLASSILNEVLKNIFGRQRPDILRLIEITGLSFPSGHSMTGMCFYGFIIYLCLSFGKGAWKYIAAALLSILILLIGISRIYLGVHYASDVLAGFSLGIVWLAVFIAVMNKLHIKGIKRQA
jgi:undecaprenyl-diphosphatase